MQLGESVELIFCFFPSWRPPPGTARSSGRPAMRRPGTKSKCSVLSWSGTGLLSICSFCMFLLLGFNGGNPGEHGENMQTPHRKAREQAPTCCTMRDLNPRPSCCEATVLRTEPPYGKSPVSGHTHTHAIQRQMSSLHFSHFGVLPQVKPGAVGSHQCGVRGPSPCRASVLHVFVVGFYGGNGPEWPGKGLQKGPGTSPGILHHAGHEPTTFLL